MGQVLTSPKRECKSELVNKDEINFAIVSMQGWRRFMEDAHSYSVALSNFNVLYFGVFDGHSGGEVSKYCARHLHECIASKLNAYTTLSEDNIRMVLESSFMAMDVEIVKEDGQKELKELAIIDEPHPELNSKAEALGRFLLERAKKKRLELKMNEAVDSTDNDDDEMAPPRAKMQRCRSLTLDGNDYLELGTARANMMQLPMEVLKSNGKENEHGLLSENEGERLASSAGSTALVALIYDNVLYVANAGDSRCVIGRNGLAFDMSMDHKPDIESEKVRILKAGGFVKNGRVNGHLNLSRAIGDMSFKKNRYLSPAMQVITCHPDVLVEPICKQDEFIILACDGIWECMDSQTVVLFIQSRLLQHRGKRDAQLASEIIQELFDTCISNNRNGYRNCGIGLDNMTATLVFLNPL